jgi:hypothetical protein
MRRASVVVPAGTPLHASGTDWPAPVHVNCTGMAPALSKAELASRRPEDDTAADPVASDTGAMTPVGVVFFLFD